MFCPVASKEKYYDTFEEAAKAFEERIKAETKELKDKRKQSE